jgi:hypothetical protein
VMSSHVPWLLRLSRVVVTTRKRPYLLASEPFGSCSASRTSPGYFGDRKHFCRSWCNKRTYPSAPNRSLQYGRYPNWLVS